MSHITPIPMSTKLFYSLMDVQTAAVLDNMGDSAQVYYMNRVVNTPGSSNFETYVNETESALRDYLRESYYANVQWRTLALYFIALANTTISIGNMSYICDGCRDMVPGRPQLGGTSHRGLLGFCSLECAKAYATRFGSQLQ